MKNISKKITGLALVALIAMLTACSGNTGTTATTEASTEAAIVKDMKNLPDELISNNIFKDQMDKTSYIEMLLGISESEYTEAVLYVGSGATSERLAVFSTGSQAMSDAIKAKCEAHLTEIKANYASYMPDEVDKIEHAVLISNEQYVVLCIADKYDDAKNMIDEYFK